MSILLDKLSRTDDSHQILGLDTPEGCDFRNQLNECERVPQNFAIQHRYRLLVNRIHATSFYVRQIHRRMAPHRQ